MDVRLMPSWPAAPPALPQSPYAAATRGRGRGGGPPPARRVAVGLMRSGPAAPPPPPQPPSAAATPTFEAAGIGVTERRPPIGPPAFAFVSDSTPAPPATKAT